MSAYDDELSNEAVGKRVAADHDDKRPKEGFGLPLRAQIEKLINLEAVVVAILRRLDVGEPIRPNDPLHILLRRAYDRMFPR